MVELSLRNWHSSWGGGEDEINHYNVVCLVREAFRVHSVGVRERHCAWTLPDGSTGLGQQPQELAGGKGTLNSKWTHSTDCVAEHLLASNFWAAPRCRARPEW